MATASQIANYSQRIYNTALAGTPDTPKGLPPVLAAILISQAKHESGNFSSSAFVDGNNAFGYTYVPGAKWQTTTPGRIADNGQPLATYASLEDSTREVVDWIHRRQKEGKFPIDLTAITNTDQYAKLLKAAGYYGDSFENYAKGLARWFVDMGKTVVNNPLAVAAVLLFLGGMTYVLITAKRTYIIK